MTFVEENIKRLERGITQCREVLDVPRRLGGDATDKELADDKRTARRVKHRLEVALEDWTRSERGSANGPLPADGTGARLVWADWWVDWRQRAQLMHQEADSRWQQHTINNELESLMHIFAELRS